LHNVKNKWLVNDKSTLHHLVMHLVMFTSMCLSCAIEWLFKELISVLIEVADATLFRDQ